ncbi:MAG: Type 1 glutamine amidotransferase-like domain-containing protein [Oscillospiraceae bacterium]|nr:Type 1 glutamine amidotransferase-like domain-containing protein [Oscillospiraceae bacterium]
MKKLFLASSFDGVASLLPGFIGEDLSGKKVAFIPTAGKLEENTFYVDADRKALEELGLIVEDLDVSSVLCDEAKDRINNSDYLFVCGGNTFFLLQELKRRGIDKLVIEHINKGKPYISTSAGSLIMQKKIINDNADRVEDAPDLKGDFSALSIIDFYIYVHYGHNYYGNDDECIDKYYSNLELIKINDKQVVTVTGEKVEVLSVG